MNKNLFFKPTPLYKEFLILDIIEKNSNSTQRDMSKFLGVSVSMINNYLDQYEKNGYIKRNRFSLKTVEYHVTDKGLERKKVLNISYLDAAQKVYNSAKEDIIEFLNRVIKNGYKDIFLYGAGEVAEILLRTIYENKLTGLNILGIIDDDQNKIGLELVNIRVVSINDISSSPHDGILIASYNFNDDIYKKLLKIDYNKEKIIRFFSLK